MVFGVVSPATVAGIPGTHSVSATDEDASVTLELRTFGIEGDSSSYCKFTVEVTSDDYQLQGGDTIDMWVYSRADNEKWSKNVTVDSSDITGGTYKETFDCQLTISDSREFYGEAEVEKQSATFDVDDNPTTDWLWVQEETDDRWEENDNASSASGTFAGSLNEGSVEHVTSGIAADEDWYPVEVPVSAKLDVTVEHPAYLGRLELSILDSDGYNYAVNAEKTPRATKLTDEKMVEGDYYVVVRPKNTVGGNGYNYYDLKMGRTIPENEEYCLIPTTETRPCRKCGTQTRECNDRVWGDWSECKNQKACEAGTTRTVECGNCGQRTDECTSNCEWKKGECKNTGVCSPGQQQQESCADGGQKTRTCSETCEWKEFTACSNEDSDSSGKEIGAPCSDAEACQHGSCLTAPDNARFEDGYCTVEGCSKSVGCPQGAFCTTIGGKNYCLTGCSGDEECRDGYNCVTKDGRRFCAPECQSDAQCESGRCNTSTGRCTAVTADAGSPTDSDAGAASPTDASVGDNAATRNPDASAPADPPEPGCGCAVRNESDSGSLPAVWVVLLLAVSMRRKLKPRT